MTLPGADGSRSRAFHASRSWQAWADLSLRTKLLLFALGLVTVPGIVFALFAFAGARAALEREVGIQLQQTAERGAEAVSATLERAQSDARSWASQDVMRDLLVGDLDKRVSRFLRTVQDHKSAYVAVLAVDRQGVVVAASSGDWIGHQVGTWDVMRATDRNAEALVGPRVAPEFAREVIEIAVPIENPDPPAGAIGTLIVAYEWRAVQELLDQLRRKLAGPGKHVAAMVIDRAGTVIGGVSFEGHGAQHSELAADVWSGVDAEGFGARTVHMSTGAQLAVLAGIAPVSPRADGWSIVVIERTAEALAPVRAVRNTWLWIIGGILLVGLAVAALLARQVLRPLNEVTRATSEIAARPELDLPLLPVRSRNEVGQLTESFNRMTTELKRSQEEALSAAKFAFAGELAAMVAHEVRTPLSVMRSSAQLLTGPAGSGSAHQAELVEAIVTEVDRVQRVVTGLIQLARPLPQRLEAAPLRELLARAADFAAGEARRQSIAIACEGDDAQPPALCDPEQIYQVILNLVVNALQALKPGGHIWLRTLHADAGTVGFEVRDDGPGLPRQIRERLFQPFVTGRDDGTGLGLSFVDRIVKAHHGRIAVRSETGGGTAFEVRLPMAEGTA